MLFNNQLLAIFAAIIQLLFDANVIIYLVGGSCQNGEILSKY